MKTKNLLLIAIMLLALTSCSKKEGCMDRDSINYDSEAEKDNGSCKYQGSYVFWIQSGDLSTGESVNVYVDGVFKGNIAVTFASVPSCGNTGALTVTKDLGGNKTVGAYVKFVVCNNSVEDPTNTFTELITFKANTCVSYQL